MFMYPEMTAKRGANEVISCLQYYIENKLSPTVTKLKIFSDGCRDRTTITQWFSTFSRWCKQVDSNALNTIFPFEGHSFLPCDRHFATIENRKRESGMG